MQTKIIPITLMPKYESGTSMYNSLDSAFGSTSAHCKNYEIGKCVRINFNDSDLTEWNLPAFGKLIAYYRHLWCVPFVKTTRTVNEANYYTIKRDFPSKFVMGTNANIYLDDSYCCIGIKEFEIEQTSNYKAIVYDKFGNLLFDGTNETAGVYKFSCNMKPLETLVVPLTNGGQLTYPAHALGYIYTGSNEEWTIEKLSVVN